LNEQSLQAANAFLRVAAETTPAGEVLKQPPAEIGKAAGLPNPLAVARAVRALAARRRLEVEDGQYRLLDARPLDPGEPESVPRAPRRRKARRKGGSRAEGAGGERKATYADLGRSVLERVIELGRESAEAVAAAEHLRREVKENKAARIEAEQRASRLFERVKELETKLEMAEQNLRTVLTAARGRGATAGPADSEMEAVLRILKAPAGSAASGTTDGATEGATEGGAEEAAGE
jgi:signal transduction histidine kinase